MKTPLVSAIIPTYNRKGKLIRLLKSLQKSDTKNLGIIVIDDSSVDGTYLIIKKIFSKIKIIKNKFSKYPTFCRNLGAKISKGKYLIFIDDDNIVAKDTISKLIEYSSKFDDIGLVGPLMYYFKKKNSLWCTGGKIHNFTFKTTHISSNKLSKTPYECDYIPNIYMIKRELMHKIKGFDYKNFPISFEEIDFANRIKKLGYRIIIVPNAKIWHDISDDQNKPTRPERYYFKGRSRVIFYKKYAPWRLILLPIDVLFFIRHKIFYNIKLEDKINLYIYYVKGMIQGILTRLYK